MNRLLTRAVPYPVAGFSEILDIFRKMEALILGRIGKHSNYT
jgi:hypothetical protein